MPTFLRLSLTALLLISLTACGFHLRGRVELPLELQRVQVQSPDPGLQRNLERALKSAGALLTDQNAATLHILTAEQQRRVLTVTSGAKVREYELNFHVRYQVRDAAGQPVLAVQALNLIRDYTFDETNLLGTTRQEEILYEEMRRDAVQLILRRLAYLKRDA